MFKDCALSIGIPIIVMPPEIKTNQVPGIRISMDDDSHVHMAPSRVDFRRSNSWNPNDASMNNLILVCLAKIL